MSDLFNNLIVFDLANNHQGSVDHGCAIIKAMGAQAQKHHVKAGLKFQFRHLDTFIHRDHQHNSTAKHILRFLETRLQRSEYEIMLKAIQDSGMLSIATPFDEASVDMLCAMGIDIIKIASCSATDWPLIEHIAQADKPVICSTGGLTLEAIDDLRCFFEHKGVDCAFMHCVALYPTPTEHMQLNQIRILRKRFPETTIGWSTHEDPNATAPVQIAYANGARMFERHVGLATQAIKLNAYSSTPEQVDQWLTALHEAQALCGAKTGRPPAPEGELDSLLSLQRGVFARETIPSGSLLTREMVYFAMPAAPGQLLSGDFRSDIRAQQNIKEHQQVALEAVAMPPEAPEMVIKHAIHDVRAMLNEAKIYLNTDFRIEYSHHHGPENFRKTGAVLINVVNREYCKKIIVQLPGQAHPEHFHKRKEETFQVLSGELNLWIEGRKRVLYPGDTCLVQPGTWHSFHTTTGCIFEEVSTADLPNDSFYKEKHINAMKREERKTVVKHWGRFELVDKMATRAS